MNVNKLLSDLVGRARRHEEQAAQLRDVITKLNEVLAAENVVGQPRRITIRKAKRISSERRDAQKSALGDRVVAILEEAGQPMRLADICEKAKAPIWNVREAVVSLEAAHSLVRVGGGVKTMYARLGRRVKEEKASWFRKSTASAPQASK